MARLRTDVPRARRGRTTLPGAPHPNPLVTIPGRITQPTPNLLVAVAGGFHPEEEPARLPTPHVVVAPNGQPTAVRTPTATPAPAAGPGQTVITPTPQVGTVAPTTAIRTPTEIHHEAAVRRREKALSYLTPLAAPTLTSPSVTSLYSPQGQAGSAEAQKLLQQLAPLGSQLEPTPEYNGGKLLGAVPHVIEPHTPNAELGSEPWDTVPGELQRRNAAVRQLGKLGRENTAELVKSGAASLGLPSAPSGAVDVADRSYTVQTPQGAVQVPGSAVAQNPKDPLGKETLGNVSLPQLRQAAQAGTLNVSQKGVLSTQQGRNVLANLLAAHKEVQASTGLTGPLTSSQKQFAKLTSKDLGGVLSPRTIAVQELQEQSGQHAIDRQNEGNFDTLDIGYTDSGPISLTKNSDWGDVASAAKATAEFFKGERFDPGAHIPEILEESKGKSVAEQLQIIGNSGWATSSYAADLANTAALVGEKHDPEAVANLVAAKHAAVKAGINPTPWNGDVQGGSSDYVTIRADAKGALSWAESAVGTQQGDPRQLHWAAITHGPEDPWCSEFVGAAMARQGIELPADPAYSGSWLKWKGGKDLGTDTSNLKPGDLIVFGQPGGEAEHVGIYKGDGEMISGNFSNEVALSDVEEEIGAAGLQGIVRPKYKGGTIKVKAGSLPGSSAGSVPGNEGSTGTSEVGPTGSSPMATPVSSTSPTGAATREAALANFTGPAAPNIGGNIFESGQPSEAEEAIRLLTQASARSRI